METEEKKGIGRLNTILIVVLVILAIVIAIIIITRGTVGSKTSYLEYAGLEDNATIQSNEFVSTFYSNIYVKGNGDSQILIIPDLSSIYSNHKDEILSGDLYGVMIENMVESAVEVDYSEDAILDVVNDFADLVVQDLNSLDVSVDLATPVD